MRRLAIVEYTMSAGGVERVLRGLAGAFLEIPEARDWDITFLLCRYDSAYRRVEWPSRLTGPRQRVEWLGQHTAASRFLDRLAHGQGLGGIPLSKPAGLVAARSGRRVGPSRWRAYLGDPATLIAQASERFDLLYFTYPVLTPPPRISVPVVTTPQDFNFRHFHPEGSRSFRVRDEPTRAWLARSDRILLTTRAVEDELLRYYPDFASKAGVIRLGLDASAPVPTERDLHESRLRHGLPRDFVLMVGWVLEHKTSSPSSRPS